MSKPDVTKKLASVNVSAPSSGSVAAVEWVDAMQAKPDSDCTVLIHCPIADDPVWLGYHDGETWRNADGEALEEEFVDHWANLPDPPPLPWHETTKLPLNSEALRPEASK